MKPNNKTYDLAGLNDLFKLHPDQLERWFDDFKKLHGLFSGLNEVVSLKQFKWKDDGIDSGVISIQNPNGKTIVELKTKRGEK